MSNTEKSMLHRTARPSAIPEKQAWMIGLHISCGMGIFNVAALPSRFSTL